jgi:hypothetical protein
MSNFTRLIPYTLDKCEVCGERHDYQLEVRRRGVDIVVFGGRARPTSELDDAHRSPAEGSASVWDVVLPCLNVQGHRLMKTVSVMPEPDEEIVGVQVHKTDGIVPHMGDQAGQPDNATLNVEQMVKADFAEWIKASASVPREFCKLMLSTTLAAIPVFYAVLSYLKFDVTIPLWGPIIGVMPPVLFLISAIMFTLAIQPQQRAVSTVEEFEHYRTQRLQRMNLFISFGSVLFVVGVIVAIAAYAWAILT